MQEALIVLAAWFLFGGSHLLLSSSGIRDSVHHRYGAKTFIVLFSLITLATMSLLIWLVARLGDQGISTAQFLQQFGMAKDSAPGSNGGMHLAATVAAALGALLAIAGLVIFPKSPIAKLSERVDPKSWSGPTLTLTLNSVDAITRHPFFIGVSVLALAHLFLVPTLATAAFFVGLAALSLVGIPLQDRKLRDRWPEDYAPYETQTSAVPFAASNTASADGNVNAQKSWTPWLWAAGITAALASVIHPLLAWGNGSGFAILILLFGLISVIAALAQDR